MPCDTMRAAPRERRLVPSAEGAAMASAMRMHALRQKMSVIQRHASMQFANSWTS